MADEKKQAPQATAQIAADEKITEKQALDDAGKVKPGFGFRYVAGRDDAGRKVSRREFFRVGR